MFKLCAHTEIPLWNRAVSRPAAKNENGLSLIGPGSIIADRFQIIGWAGQGGISTVYNARDLSEPSKLVAIKLPQLEKCDRLHAAKTSIYREAIAFDMIDQRLPLLPEYYGLYFSRDDIPFIAMELLAGDTLKSQHLTLAEILRITLQICGLHALHTCGFVHLDIKPSNILFKPDKKINILDLGMIRPRGEYGHKIKLGATPRFCSPEQARIIFGNKTDPLIPLTPASDIYSLAITLFELTYCFYPFPTSSTESMLRFHASAEPVPPLEQTLLNKRFNFPKRGREKKMGKELYHELRGLLIDMTKKDPAERVNDLKDVYARVDLSLLPLAEALERYDSPPCLSPARP
jgi:serine/threonine protein kinase